MYCHVSLLEELSAAPVASLERKPEAGAQVLPGPALCPFYLYQFNLCPFAVISSKCECDSYLEFHKSY